MSRHLRNGIAVVVALLAPGLALAASITVNTATDDFGSVTSNCSLREAIQSANGNANFGGCVATGIYNDAITDVIELPTLGAGGFFTLNRIGTDDSNASGDLDIAGSLRIDGVGTANSVIRGDTTDPDSDRHRLVHVISGTVTLNDLTLRNGLEDGATAGGGLRTEPGSTTTLNRVIVTLNTAGGNAGGILNRGTMRLFTVLVSNNEATDAVNGGGGIAVSPGAALEMTDSRVLNNLANCVDDNVLDSCGGGGIYVGDGGTLSILNSAIETNVVDSGFLQGEPLAGGGILSAFDASVVDIEQSTINGNRVAESMTDQIGGGALIAGSSSSVRRSLISNNTIDAGGLGGGMQMSDGELVESIVRGNSAGVNSGGGGLRMLSGRILGSTIVGNSASSGGGVILFQSDVVNSTIVGNTADSFGGGIGVLTGSTSRLFSTTVVANTVTDSNGAGGGIRVGDGNFLSLVNTVIAGNSADIGTDCSGTYDATQSLIQIDSGCTVIGDAIRNVTAGLAPLASNGGPVVGSSNATVSAVMLTRAPLISSPLIDAGVTGGCRDQANLLLPTDQIGRPRAVDGPDPDTTARCDIGAVEFVDSIFKNGFE